MSNFVSLSQRSSVMRRILPDPAEGARAIDSLPPGRTETLPARAGAFWTGWFLMAIAGEMAGQAINHLYIHRSGRVIVAVMLCVIAILVLQRVTGRQLRATFWSVAFLLGVLGAVLGEAIDTAMGIGDIAAIVLIAIPLMFACVLCYRFTGNLPALAALPGADGYFWATAMLAQTIGSACADWIIESGDPAMFPAVVAVALGVPASIGLFLWTRRPHGMLFWIAFLLVATSAALGGHAIANAVVNASQPCFPARCEDAVGLVPG
jgi:uncharacterized membrane-anchored protein